MMIHIIMIILSKFNIIFIKIFGALIRTICLYLFFLLMAFWTKFFWGPNTILLVDLLDITENIN